MKSKLFRILGVATTVAVLASMLAVAPALGLGTPTVSITPVAAVVGVNSTYTIMTSVNVALAAGDKIDVTFPTGTGISAITAAADADVQVGASAGVPPSVGFVLTASASTVVGQVLTIVTPAAIGAGALVQIQIGASTANCVTNPATAGTGYTISVATKTALNVALEAVVTSTPYTINPYVAPIPPGLVKVFYGTTLIWQGSYLPGDLSTAITTKVAAGYTIELGPGLYVETTLLTLGSTACDTLTIKASGALADTIVPADWVINSDTVTFKGITFMNETTLVGPPFTINAGATGNKFDGCAFVKSGTATTTVAETFINYINTTASSTCTITNCTFDTTLGSVVDTPITDTGVGLTISNNTFTLDADLAVPQNDDKAITAGATVTVSGNTFNGASAGIGVYCSPAAAATITISGNTFNAVRNAMYAISSFATVNFTGNTVTGCGLAVSTTLTGGSSPIVVLYDTLVNAAQNKITGSKAFIASIFDAPTYSSAAQAHIIYNDLSGNTLGILNASGAAHTNHVDATRNWWGAATGPSAAQVTYGTSLAGGVDASNYLVAAPTNAAVAFAQATLDAKTTTGVIINQLKTDGTPPTILTGIMGIATFSANSAPGALPSTLTGAKYFDVFVTGQDGSVTTVRVFFYGAITANSQAWVYSPFAGTWVKCSNQSINTTSGFIAVDITATTTPSIIDMAGTPFALVEAPPAAPPASTVAQSPKLGESNVPINTSFTWPAVTGAVSYEWQMSAEAGLTDKFSIIDDSKAPTVTACKPTEDLLYNTTYYWRVRSVNNVGAKSAWTESFFTTEKEPVVVEPTPPVEIIQQAPPEITLTIPGDTVQEVQVIPAYLLWLVIAIGAVLIIAVIVLIARTRRIT